MSKLYIASQNIRAGKAVKVIGPSFDSVCEHDILTHQEGSQISVVIGIAAENLREGFRVVVRDGEVFEDDA